MSPTRSAGGIEIMWDGAVIAEMLRSPSGPVGLHLIERGTVCQTAAKAQVGVDTGRLRASIVKRMTDEGDLGIMVGCDTVPYALMHHEGTEAHVIVPRKPGGTLAFKVGGVMVFAKKVNHPGTRPNRYLADVAPLAIAG